MRVPVLTVAWLPQGAIGIALAVVIVLRKTRTKSTASLIAHERVHIRQQWRYWLLGFATLYFFSRKWRLRFEAEAYATSVLLGEPLNCCARALASPMYRLRITEQQAADAIRAYL